MMEKGRPPDEYKFVSRGVKITCYCSREIIIISRIINTIISQIYKKRRKDNKEGGGEIKRRGENKKCIVNEKQSVNGSPSAVK